MKSVQEEVEEVICHQSPSWSSGFTSSSEFIEASPLPLLTSSKFHQISCAAEAEKIIGNPDFPFKLWMQEVRATRKHHQYGR